MSQCEPKQDTAWLAVPLLHHANSRSARLCNYMGDGERSNRRVQGCTVKREVRRQVLHKDWNNSRELSSEKSLCLTNGRTTRQMACVSDSREQNKKTTNDVFRTITQDHLLTITAAQSQIHRTGCLSFRRKRNFTSRHYADMPVHSYINIHLTATCQCMCNKNANNTLLLRAKTV